MSQNATNPMAINVQSFQSSGPMVFTYPYKLVLLKSIYFLGGNAIIDYILINEALLWQKAIGTLTLLNLNHDAVYVGA